MAFSRFDLAAFENAKGSARLARAAQLDAICRETGFLVLEGHGVDHETIDAIWAACDAFFALPAATKSALTPKPGDPYGYLGPKAEALAASKGVDTPPDLKESFNGGPARVPDGLSDPDALAFCFSKTPFPDLPGFQEAWTRFYATMEALARRIMRAFAAALGLEERYFDNTISEPISALRALHYPPTGHDIEALQQRAGAHSDYGTLTILLPQHGSSGLQIFREGSWSDVPAPEGAFVINIGDLMERWTANRWVSTLHRVVAKPRQPARKSLAYFHQPNWFAEITPLDGSDTFEPVLSGPYLMEKFRSTGV